MSHHIMKHGGPSLRNYVYVPVNKQRIAQQPNIKKNHLKETSLDLEMRIRATQGRKITFTLQGPLSDILAQTPHPFQVAVRLLNPGVAR